VSSDAPPLSLYPPVSTEVTTNKVDCATVNIDKITYSPDRQRHSAAKRHLRPLLRWHCRRLQNQEIHCVTINKSKCASRLQQVFQKRADFAILASVAPIGSQSSATSPLRPCYRRRLHRCCNHQGRLHNRHLKSQSTSPSNSATPSDTPPSPILRWSFYQRQRHQRQVRYWFQAATPTSTISHRHFHFGQNRRSRFRNR